MKAIHTLLVDDHTLFREGLALILQRDPQFKIVGEAEDGLTAVAIAQQVKPHLVLMDINLPGVNGVTATRMIKQTMHDVKVVMLTEQTDQQQALESLTAGADGYLHKTVHSPQLIEILRATVSNENRLHVFLPKSPPQSSQSPSDTTTRGLATLTQREREIAKLVCMGAGDREIAAALHLSLHTIKTHVRHILAKVQVSSRREVAQLVRNLETN